jgi:hypothetical protein
MRSRIDLRPVLTDPLHPVRILLYIICALVLLEPVQSLIIRKAGWAGSYRPLFTVFPPTQPADVAGGIEVLDGVLQFNGQSVRGVWTGPVTMALGAIVVLYLIGPALLVWGIRARARYRQSIPVRGGATAIAFALALGGVSLLTVLPTPVYAIIGARTKTIMMRDSRSSDNLDLMSVDLYMMARKAQVRYFLSGNPRDAKHSWCSPHGSGKAGISIADLVTADRKAFSGDSVYVSPNGTRFSLHVEHPDSLTIYGVREWEGMGPWGLSSDGTQKPLQICIGVTPDNVNMVMQ